MSQCRSRSRWKGWCCPIVGKLVRVLLTIVQDRTEGLVTVLLWIHRSYFAQAIIDCPTNPLRSQYASSFLATYRASGIILRTIKNQFSRYPSLCARFWLTWTYAFSAAVRLILSSFQTSVSVIGIFCDIVGAIQVVDILMPFLRRLSSVLW